MKSEVCRLSPTPTPRRYFSHCTNLIIDVLALQMGRFAGKLLNSWLDLLGSPFRWMSMRLRSAVSRCSRLDVCLGLSMTMIKFVIKLIVSTFHLRVQSAILNSSFHRQPPTYHSGYVFHYVQPHQSHTVMLGDEPVLSTRVFQDSE